MRIDADLLQKDVAAAIGLTQRKYSYIETGTQQATEDVLCQLALFYGVSVDYLLKLTDDKTPYPRRKNKV
ncbi:MAG: helix-turn-helix domain-containing protein [Oscillospiraceae bacterium]|nr:helix-turn-helix domain-containing protein [Oscillospiraceae bacterium]